MTVNKLQQLEESKLRLEAITEELRKRGYEKALSERAYRRSLAKKELTLKTRGNNFPAGMVSDMARGDEEVSELRYKRDIAQIDYDICKDKLRNERSQIEILRSLVAYDRATYLNS